MHQIESIIFDDNFDEKEPMNNNKDGRTLYKMPVFLRKVVAVFQPGQRRRKKRPQGIHRKKLAAIIQNLERTQPNWTDLERRRFAAKIFLQTS